MPGKPAKASTAFSTMPEVNCKSPRKYVKGFCSRTSSLFFEELEANFAAEMLIEVLQAKIHNVRITQTELNYTGSITIDQDLVDAAGLLANQKVLIVNNNNGERFETYIISGERGTGVIGLNGAAARRGQIGDELIIMTFGQLSYEAAKTHQPRNIFPDRNNKLV
jgi:aspartate 1-decarboxylase